MRRVLGLLLAFAFVFCLSAIAGEVTPLTELGLSESTPAPAPVVPVIDVPAVAPASPGIGAAILAFLNSNAGAAAILGIIGWVLTWVFTKKPEWKVLVEKYGPIFMELIKAAEKAIPDTTANAGLARLDWVLKQIILRVPALASVSPDVLKAAITAVHAEAEAKENI